MQPSAAACSQANKGRHKINIHRQMRGKVSHHLLIDLRHARSGAFSRVATSLDQSVGLSTSHIAFSCTLPSFLVLIQVVVNPSNVALDQSSTVGCSLSETRPVTARTGCENKAFLCLLFQSFQPRPVSSQGPPARCSNALGEPERSHRWRSDSDDLFVQAVERVEKCFLASLERRQRAVMGVCESNLFLATLLAGALRQASSRFAPRGPLTIACIASKLHQLSGFELVCACCESLCTLSAFQERHFKPQ